MTPLVSVIVRSYNRLGSLCELLEALLRQRYPRFEVIVVEQSTTVTAAALARLAELSADHRVSVIRRPPRGGAAARNEGAAAARGEILLFIDDDDLPAGEDWIAGHAALYEDPRCLAVSGRQVYEDDPRPAGESSSLLEWVTGTLSLAPLLRLPLCHVRHGRRRIPVGAIHGTNASVRHSAVERFGGWDTDTSIEDETSFCIRAQRHKERDEYFAYDPRPLVIRRRDIAGGLDKRKLTARRFFGRYLDFVHVIIRRYHPARVVLLYPLYLLAAYVLAAAWVCAESRRYPTIPRRMAALAALLAEAPFLALTSIFSSMRLSLSRSASSARSG